MDITKKVWEILLTEEEINNRITQLGKQLSDEYRDEKLLVVSLLKGSFIFTADLVRKMDIPVKIEFMTTSSYGHSEASSGQVKILTDVGDDLSGYHVLVADDITDSGLTMKYVMAHLSKKNPESVKCCVLLDKPDRRVVDLVPDYHGFTIPDKFVVGYGLNYGDYFRNIPYVFVVTDKDR